MREYTKEAALRECYNLWRWIASQSNYTDLVEVAVMKRQWPGWRRVYKKYNISYTFFADRVCPACAYVAYTYRRASWDYRCNFCPVPVLREHGCSSFLSPYKQWRENAKEGNNAATAACARIIMRSARSALESLKRKEKKRNEGKSKRAN